MLDNCGNYHNINGDIEYICKNEYNYFLSKENVEGMALGYKIKNGFYTDEKCIKIFVSRKISVDQLNSNDIVPIYYKGIKTDVEESGKFYAQALSKRIRPVYGGYSVSPAAVNSYGTMGCVVTDGKNYYILSNNHVLADENFLPIGADIVQPGVLDGGKDKKDTIATLSKYVPLKFEKILYHPENHVDCAMAKVIEKSMISSKVAFIGNLSGLIDAKLNQSVVKVGRTTGQTSGVVTGLHATIKVQYYKGKALFKDQILTTDMSESGDSGAVLVDILKDVIGLLSGGSDSKSTFNPIKTVLSSLHVRIVTS